jgi:DNA-binding transcriptional MerR regulator
VSAARTLRIGEVAQRTGTTPRTIRYYEEIGLLPTAPGREPGSHRLYDESDVERLVELLSLRDLLGIPLDELRELAAAESARAALRKEWHSGVDDPVRKREIVEEGLHHIDRQLELVRGRRAALERLDEQLTTRRRRLRSRLRALTGTSAGKAAGEVS